MNTASLEAYQHNALLIDYAATTGAVNNFSKALAGQLAPQGIRVNVVGPGPTWTALQISGGFPIEQIPQYGHDTPVGRSGQPAELAPAYVVAETLSVHGGMPTS